MTHFELYDKVKTEVQRYFANHGESAVELGRCFWWSYFGMLMLRANDIEAVPQAGTAYWPRLPKEQLGEDMNSVFGFQWDPDSLQSRIAVATGALPECHVWLGIVSSQELIDLSTGDWPAICRTLLGHDWPGQQPPPFFWGQANNLPDNVYYEPIRDATIRVGRLFERLLTHGLGIITRRSVKESAK